MLGQRVSQAHVGHPAKKAREDLTVSKVSQATTDATVDRELQETTENQGYKRIRHNLFAKKSRFLGNYDFLTLLYLVHKVHLAAMVVMASEFRALKVPKVIEVCQVLR